MFLFAPLLANSLLWWLGGGAGASPLHNISPRMVLEPASECSTDGDCGGVLRCDLELRACRCRDKYAVLAENGGGCLPARQLGEACVEDSQCRVLERNASCEDQSCVCDSGFYLLHDNNGSLCNPDKTADIPKASIDPNMIIVLAVLSIMFIGICVALHLFSKARFGNRRTIFNSPHPRNLHIKLGKRKKSSVRTHHLPPPPVVSRHHSFSGHHSPYPLAKVPKTRSHDCLRTSLSREMMTSSSSTPHFEPPPRPKTAPLAERESLPSSEELDKKTPEPVLNGVPRSGGVTSLEGSERTPPGSPTVIITDADGAHTVVTHTHPPPSSSAVDV